MVKSRKSEQEREKNFECQTDYILFVFDCVRADIQMANNTEWRPTTTKGMSIELTQQLINNVSDFDLVFSFFFSTSMDFTSWLFTFDFRVIQNKLCSKR